MNVTSTHLRNRNFVKLCRDRLEKLKQSKSTPSIQQVVIDVLSKPAPSYYVDYFQACSILVKALREGGIPPGVYTCTEQWQDMYRDLLSLMKRHPTTPLRRLICDLCSGYAGNPRFYISPQRGMRILYPYVEQELKINCNL